MLGFPGLGNNALGAQVPIMQLTGLRDRFVYLLCHEALIWFPTYHWPWLRLPLHQHGHVFDNPQQVVQLQWGKDTKSENA